MGGSIVDIAAIQIAELLQQNDSPGTVWYSRKANRFRLTGEGYRPKKGESCCGVYLPGAPPEALAEDFQFVIDNEDLP